MMKKLPILLLALSLTFSLAACGGKANEKEPAEPPVSGANGNTPNEPDTPNNPDTPDEPDAPDEPSRGETTFDGLLAVDNDQCSVELTAVEDDPIWGYTIKATLENKSEEKTYMFSVDSASVNGVKCDPFFASEVAPGKKASEEISFDDSTFRDNDIGAYTDIAMTFRIHDSNDWTADPVALETVHVYPYGEENAAAYVRESRAEDVVLVDNDSVTAIVTGYTEDDIWGWTAELYLVNKTDKTVMFSVDEASVNGYMADPFFSAETPPKTCAFEGISWSESTFEENGITDVEELEFKLKAYDSDNWTADPFAEEVVTLNP